MDPYLEHPALWPDVHNSLIAAIRDALAPRVAPRYYIALERRAYRLAPGDLVFVGRPDVGVVAPTATGMPARQRTMGLRSGAAQARVAAAPVVEGHAAGDDSPGGTVIDVEVFVADEVADMYLEVRGAVDGELVTLMEVLSPANKLYGPGRNAYLRKREDVLDSRTSLIEIDLLRAGEPMPLVGPPTESEYRILLSRGRERPRAKLYAFGVRDAIPVFPLPLRPGEDEPEVDLNRILHDLYDRARFDLQVDYNQPPVPPLARPLDEWARARVAAAY